METRKVPEVFRKHEGLHLQSAHQPCSVEFPLTVYTRYRSFLYVAAAYRTPTTRQELHQLAVFVSQLSPKQCGNIPD